MPVKNIGTHQTHCCKIHGCKYGDDECPVVDSSIIQAYPCEDCEEVEEQIRNLKYYVKGLEESLKMDHNKSKLTMDVSLAINEVNKQINILETAFKK